MMSSQVGIPVTRLSLVLSLLTILMAGWNAPVRAVIDDYIDVTGEFNTWPASPNNMSFGGESSQAGDFPNYKIFRLTQQISDANHDEFKFKNWNDWTNQWLASSSGDGSADNVTLNSVFQVYFDNSDPRDNLKLASVTSGWRYTFRFYDSGYGNSYAIVMATSAAPVSISSVRDEPDTFASAAIDIPITLSGALCTEEKCYLVYTTDNWSTRDAVTATQVSGGNYKATIPAQKSGTRVQYYVITTTVSEATYEGYGSDRDRDLASLSGKNNSGSAFDFYVGYVRYSGEENSWSDQNTYMTKGTAWPNSGIWYTRFQLTNTGNDEFKFVHGTSAGAPWAQQWMVGTNSVIDNVNLNTPITVVYATADPRDNMSIQSIVANNYYTFKLDTSGMRAGILGTSAVPIGVSAVLDEADTKLASDVSIPITLSGSKCAEENVLLVYTTDDWTSRGASLASGSGVNYAATIPGQRSGRTVKYYAITTPVTASAFQGYGSDADRNIVTLAGLNNSGSNYQYDVSYVRVTGDVNSWSETTTVMADTTAWPNANTWYVTTQIAGTTNDEFKFARGTATGAWTDQWMVGHDGGVDNVNCNTPITLEYRTSDPRDNMVIQSMQDNHYYTFKVNTSALVGAVHRTTSAPVRVTSVQLFDRVSSGIAPQVKIVLSGTPSTEEKVLLVSTSDNWSTRTVAQATGSGTTWYGRIPAAAAGSTVKYYVITSTVDATTFAGYSDDNTRNIMTLSGLNNAGSNYSYTTGNYPIITEVMADPNDPAAASTDDELEFVEIYNPTGVAIDLTGYKIYVGNTADNIVMWSGNGTGSLNDADPTTNSVSLAAGQYAVILDKEYGTTANNQPYDFPSGCLILTLGTTNFNTDHIGSSDTIWLSNGTNSVDNFGSNHTPNAKSAYSVERLNLAEGDSSGNWYNARYFCYPSGRGRLNRGTPGRANGAPLSTRDVIISEVFWDEPAAGNCWIELYNTSTTKTFILDTFTFEAGGSNIFNASLLAGETLGPQMYYLIEEAEAATNPTADKIDATLLSGPAQATQMVLKDNSGASIDATPVNIPNYAMDNYYHSFERRSLATPGDGTDAANWQDCVKNHFSSGGGATFRGGTPKAAPASFTSAGAAVYFSEFMRSVSGSADYIELFNDESDTVNIGGWSLYVNGGRDVGPIPAGSVIYPDSYFLIEDEEAATSVTGDLTSDVIAGIQANIDQFVLHATPTNSGGYEVDTAGNGSDWKATTAGTALEKVAVDPAADGTQAMNWGNSTGSEGGVTGTPRTANVYGDATAPEVTVYRDMYVIHSDGQKYGKLFNVAFADASSNLDSAWIMGPSFTDTCTIFQSPGSSSYSSLWAVSNAFTAALPNGANTCYIQARDVFGNVSSAKSITIQKEVINASSDGGDTRDWQSDEYLTTRKSNQFRIAWDDTSIFFSYGGANGNLKISDFFIYIATPDSAGTGSTNTTIDWGGDGTHTLPFHANYAIGVDGNGLNDYAEEQRAEFHKYNGGWPVGGTFPTDSEFYYGWPDTKTTECRFNWSSFGGKPAWMKLVVIHQYEQTSHLYNSYPPGNPAPENTGQTLTEYYFWQNLYETTAPSAAEIINVTGAIRTVDGDPDDWTDWNAAYDDTSIVRDSEFIWKASTGDVRGDAADPDDDFDLTSFRTIGDANNLYCLFQFNGISNAARPWITFCIDTDQVASSGQAVVGSSAKMNTVAAAEWEIQPVVNLNKTGYNNQTFGWTWQGNSYIHASNKTIEYSIPWAAVSRTGTPPARLRFTVMTALNSGGDAAQVTGGAEDPRALDGVTAPWAKNSGNYSNESSDGTADYYFEVDYDTWGAVVLNHIKPTAHVLTAYTSRTYGVTLNAVDFNDIPCTMRQPGGTIQYSHNGHGALTVVDTASWTNGVKGWWFSYDIPETITITCTEPLHGKSGSFTIGFTVDTYGVNKWYVNDLSTAGDSWTSAHGYDTQSGLSPFVPKRTLDEIFSMVTVGDTIYIDNASVTATASLTLNTGPVFVIGVDSLVSIINFVDSTAGRSLKVAGGNDSLTMRNMQVRQAHYGLWLEGADGCLVESTTFALCGEVGVYFTQSGGDVPESSFFGRCHIYKGKTGVFFNETARKNYFAYVRAESTVDRGFDVLNTAESNVFIGCEARQVDGTGFRIGGNAMGNQFLSCTSANHGWYAFEITNSAANYNVFRYNLASGGSNNLYHLSNGCDYSTFVGNRASNATGNGFYIHDGALYSTFTENIAETCSLSGFCVSDADSITFNSNRSYGNGDNGFRVQSGANHISFNADTATTNQDHGFQILTDTNTLSYCLAESNGLNGGSAGQDNFIVNGGDSNVFRYCQARQSESAGFSLVNGANFNTFHGNVSRENKSCGFWIDAKENRFDSNLAAYNGWHGMVYYASGSACTSTRNWIIGNTGSPGHGVRVFGAACSNVFTLDLSEQNANEGFAFEENSYGNKMTYCTSTASVFGYGVKFDNAPYSTISRSLVHSNSSGGAAGIYIISSRNCLIESNVVRNNAAKGIQLEYDDTGTRVVGNSVYANGNDGILVGNWSDSCVVSGNYVAANGNNGIGVWQARSLLIHANDCETNTANGIWIGGPAYSTVITVSNNVLRSNSQSGLATSELGGANNLVFGNHFSGNTNAGIYYGNVSTMTITRNNLLDATKLQGEQAAGMTATRNWWGTRDSVAIQAAISGTHAGAVSFAPFRLGPVDTQAGADTYAPSAPSNVAASGLIENVTVTWDAVATDEEANDFAVNLAGYRIYRSEQGDTALWEYRGSVAAGTLTFSDSNCQVMEDYHYRVTAYDATDTVNESWYSDTARAYTGDTSGANKWYVNDGTYDGNDSFTGAVGVDANHGLLPGKPRLTLNAVWPHITSGDTVYIDAGTFTPGETLSLVGKSSVWILGVDSGKTVVDFGSTTQENFRSMFCTGAAYVTVRDLQVKNGYFGLYFRFIDTGEITRVRATANNNIGIILETSSDSNAVTNCRADNQTTYGFYLGDANFSTLHGNLADANGSYGYALVAASDSNILRENVSTGNLKGYLLENYAVGNMLYRNASSSNTGAGYVIENTSSYNTFRENTSTSDGAQGFYLSDDQYDAWCNVFESNTVTNPGWDAFYVKSHQCTLTRNIVNGGTDKGIFIEGSNDCTLDTNTVSLANDVGIHVLNLARATLRGNHVERSKVDGIKLENVTNCYVEGCTTRQNTAAGFVIGGGSTGIRVFGCTSVVDSTGIYSDGGGGNTFEQVYIDNSKDNGFLIYNNDDTYLQCTVNSPGDVAGNAGFKLQETACRNLFISNRVVDPNSYGFNLTQQSCTNVFRLNQVSGATGAGFFLETSDGNNFTSNFTTGHGNDGFKCDNGSDSNGFHSDSTSGGTLSGFSALGGSVNNVYTSCTALSSGSQGFYMNANGSTLRHCLSRYATQQAFLLLSGSGMSITECRAEYPANASFNLSSADNCQVTACTSVGSGNDAYKVEDADGNVFSGNRAETSLFSGFAILGTSVNNLFKFNTCSGAHTVGFYVAQNDNRLYSNRAYNCRGDGFSVDGVSGVHLVGNQSDSNAGAQFAVQAGTASLTFAKNSIFLRSGATNGLYSMVANLPAERNYWGTRDTSVIKSYMYGDEGRSVDYLPFRLGPMDTTVTTDSVAPAAPDTVAAASSGSETVTISWAVVTADEETDENNTNLAGYRVYRSVSAETTLWGYLGSVPAGTDKFNDSGLTAGTTWYYVVTAYDDVTPHLNEGYYSASASASPLFPVIVISEFGLGYYDDTTDSCFVEFFIKDDNSGGAPVNLKNWKVYVQTSGNRAQLRKTFGDLIVSESSFVTLYFQSEGTDEATDGTDSRAKTYTTTTNSAGFTNTRGTIQLVSTTASDTRDAVAWSDQSTALGAEIADMIQLLVTAGQWGPDNTPASTASNSGILRDGASLRRDLSFSDNNTSADWSLDSQTPGNMPLARYVITPNMATVTGGDSFNIFVEAIDARNDTIVGARLRPQLTVSTGVIVPQYVHFTFEPPGGLVEGDTNCSAAIVGASGSVTCTLTSSSNRTGTFTISVQAPHDSFEVLMPSKVIRSANTSLRVRASDRFGNTASTFTGTVYLNVDSYAITPASVTFIAADAGDTTFPVQLSGVGLITVTCTTATGKSGSCSTVPVPDTHLVLSEFLVNDDNRPSTTIDRDEYIEIHNRGWSVRDLTNYTLKIVTYTDVQTYTFPALNLPAGKFVVLHLNKTGVNDTNFGDTDGAAHLYAINAVPPLSDYEDAIPHSASSAAEWTLSLGLYNSTTKDSTTVLDFVGAERGATSDSQLSDTDAWGAAIWRKDLTLNFPSDAAANVGRSFYRTDEREDLDITSEWSTISAAGATDSYRYSDGFSNRLNTWPTAPATITLKTSSAPSGPNAGDTFVAGDTIYITLAGTDADAAAVNTTNVFVFSDTDPTGIVVTLKETGNNTGTFIGECYAATSPQESNDGMRIILAEPGDSLTVQWVGSTDVKKSSATTGTLDHFLVVPSTYYLNEGDAIELTITAQDKGNYTITSHTGAATITLSDSEAYPSSFTWTASDNGETTFSVIIGAAPGAVTLTTTSATRTGTCALTVLSDTGYRVSEVLPNPDPAGIDWDGGGAPHENYDEWVQLYNAYPNDLTIEGYKLFVSGSASGITLAGTLPGYGWVTVYRATSGNSKSYHFDAMDSHVETQTSLTGLWNGGLVNTGGTVYLVDNNGSTVAVLVYPGGIADDQSYGRAPDGANRYRTFTRPSPGPLPTPAPDNCTSPNAVIQLHAPDSVAIGAGFTVNAAMVTQSGETVTTFTGLCTTIIVQAGSVTPTVSPATVTFTAGLLTTSLTVDTGNKDDTATLIVRYRGSIQSADSIYLREATSLSLDSSQVNVTQAIADGIDTAIVQVIVLNTAGSALSGRTVTISSSKNALDTIAPSSAVTDANGVATFTVVSRSTTASKITVDVDGSILRDSPYISWLDPSESGVRTTFGTLTSIASTDDDSHFIFYPTWSRDGKWIAYLAKTAAQDTWNIYVDKDENQDGVFDGATRVTGAQHQVFMGSRIAFIDILDGAGARVAAGDVGDGTLDVVFSAYTSGTNKRELYAVRASGADAGTAQASTVKIANAGGAGAIWMMPSHSGDTTVFYAIHQGSVYRIPIGAGAPYNVGGGTDQVLVLDFQIGGLPHAAADIAMYNKNVMAVSMVLNKLGDSRKNRQGEILILTGVDTAGYNNWGSVNNVNCFQMKRRGGTDTGFCWNVSWDTGGRALSFAVDQTGRFNNAFTWAWHYAPERNFMNTNFDVMATYVTDTWFTPNYPTNLINNASGLDDMSAGFSQGSAARAAYVSYNRDAGTVGLKIARIDGTTTIDQSGGILFQDGRVTAIIDESDNLSGSVNLRVEKPSDVPASSTPESIALTGKAREFFPDGHTFDDSITVILYYDAGDLAAAGIADGTADEYLLKVFWYNTTAGAWVDYGAVVDPTNQNGALGKLTFTTKHFSTYGIGYVPQAPVAPLAPLAVRPAHGESVTIPSPVFSWIHRDSQSRSQVGVQLQVSADPSFALPLFTENRTTSETSITPSNSLPRGDSLLYWRVRTAAAPGAFGAWSAGDSLFFTRLRVPGAPTILAPQDAIETRQARPTFAWIHSDADGDTQHGFQIVVADDSTFENPPVSVIHDSTASSFRLAAGLADGLHYWRVRTADATGYGAWSDDRTITINTKPLAPVAVTVPGPVTSPAVLLSWTHVDPESRAQAAMGIEIASDSSFATLLASVAADTAATSAHVTGEALSALRGVSTLHVRVRTAASGRNFGPWTTGTVEARLNPPSAPALVAPVDALETTAASITLQWTHVDAEGNAQAGYSMEVARDAGFASKVVDHAAWSPATSFPVTGLAGGLYHWRVATRDEVGLGSWSATRTFRVDSRSLAPLPSSPAQGAIVATARPTFAWAHRDPAGLPQTSARLEISTDSTFTSTWRTVVVVGSALTRTLEENESLPLRGESTVYWRVRTASFGTDYGPVSAESSFLLRTAPPGTPILLTPSNGTVTRQSEMEFQWDPNLPPEMPQTEFEFHISTDSFFADSRVYTGEGVRSVPSDLPDWRRRYWRVRAANAMGWGPWSETRSFNPPVWRDVALTTPRQVPAGETVTIGLQLFNGAGAATEWTGGPAVTVGGRTYAGTRLLNAADPTKGTLALRFDTNGTYVVNLGEEQLADSVTIYVLVRPSTGETYVIACGPSGVGQRFLPNDTSMTAIFRAQAPDSGFRLRIATMNDTTILGLTAPTLVDTAGYVYWESIPVALTPGRRVQVQVYRNGQLVSSDLAFVLMNPAAATQFLEHETSTTRAAVTVPAGSVSQPVWIRFVRNGVDSSLDEANRHARTLGRRFLDGTGLDIICEDLNGNTISSFSRDLTLHLPSSGGNALRIAYLNGNRWMELDGTVFDSALQEARVSANHLSVWGLTVGFPGTGNVGLAVPYPNPWRSDGPSAGYVPTDPRFGVKFDQLPTGLVRFRIYTISGELVLDGSLDPSSLGATAANGHLQVVDVGGATGQVTRWDLKNQHGNDVASGLYMVVLEGPGGRAVKRVAIIR